MYRFLHTSSTPQKTAVRLGHRCFSSTSRDHRNHTTPGMFSRGLLHGGVEHHAAACGEKLAIVEADSGEALSFAQLDSLGNRIGKVLLDECGLVGGGNSPVGVATDMGKGQHSVGAMLGALKTGNPYLPVDLSLANRTQTMLEDAKVKVVLTDTDDVPPETAEAARKAGAELVNIESLASVRSSSSTLPGLRPSNRPEEELLAYVLYTSGSTGKVTPSFAVRKTYDEFLTPPPS